MNRTNLQIIYSFRRALEANYLLTEEQQRQVMLFCYYHKNDFPIPMHSHEFYEINVVVEGSGTHFIENNSFPTSSGDFFFIPPDIHHGYAEESDLSIFHMILSDRFFARYREELRAIHGFSLLFNIEPRLRAKNNLKIFPRIAAGDFMYFRNEMNKLYKLNHAKDSLHETEKCIKALNLIYEFSEIATSHDYRPENRPFVDIGPITNVLTYIENNYNNKITLEELSAVSNMSRSTLLNQFHALCNCSPTEYLQSVRIENAKKMLEETDRSIATVAQECGFYDSSHFTKAFLQKTSMLPKEYRRTKS